MECEPGDVLVHAGLPFYYDYVVKHIGVVELFRLFFLL